MRARPVGPAQSSVFHDFARSGPTKEAHRRALNRSGGLQRSVGGRPTPQPPSRRSAKYQQPAQVYRCADACESYARLRRSPTFLRPTAVRVLGALRIYGPLAAEQLAAQLSTQGRTASRATIARALVELTAAGAAAIDAHTGRWTIRPATQHPLLQRVDLHGAHDFRHTFSTWLEDAGIPARVIDELMGHQATGRAGRHQASAIGAHHRHTTPEMAARVVAAVEERLVIVLTTAEAALDQQPW